MFYQFRPGSIIVTILVLHPDVSCLLISPSVSVRGKYIDDVLVES
jgi:hypothetical protein